MFFPHIFVPLLAVHRSLHWLQSLHQISHLWKYQCNPYRLCGHQIRIACWRHIAIEMRFVIIQHMKSRGLEYSRDQRSEHAPKYPKLKLGLRKDVRTTIESWRPFGWVHVSSWFTGCSWLRVSWYPVSLSAGTNDWIHQFSSWNYEILWIVSLFPLFNSNPCDCFGVLTGLKLVLQFCQLSVAEEPHTHQKLLAVKGALWIHPVDWQAQIYNPSTPMAIMMSNGLHTSQLTSSPTYWFEEKIPRQSNALK